MRSENHSYGLYGQASYILARIRSSVQPSSWWRVVGPAFQGGPEIGMRKGFVGPGNPGPPGRERDSSEAAAG